MGREVSGGVRAVRRGILWGMGRVERKGREWKFNLVYVYTRGLAGPLTPSFLAPLEGDAPTVTHESA